MRPTHEWRVHASQNRARAAANKHARANNTTSQGNLLVVLYMESTKHETGSQQSATWHDESSDGGMACTAREQRQKQVTTTCATISKLWRTAPTLENFGEGLKSSQCVNESVHFKTKSCWAQEVVGPYARVTRLARYDGMLHQVPFAILASRGQSSMLSTAISTSEHQLSLNNSHFTSAIYHSTGEKNVENGEHAQLAPIALRSALNCRNYEGNLLGKDLMVEVAVAR